MILYQEKDIYTFVHNIVKEYPDHLKIISYNDPYAQRISGFESTDEKDQAKYPRRKNALVDRNSLDRTKTKLADIVLCNGFNGFATFTFNNRRTDIDYCKYRIHNWLNNQQHHFGRFGYVIVPEFHKDLQALHFHALFQDFTGKLNDSGIKKNNLKIYNLNWKNGFTTYTKIRSKKRTANYVKKYITKDMPVFSNKKRYWCSQGLKRPKVYYNLDIINNPFIKTKLEFENNFLKIRTCDNVELLNLKEGVYNGTN